MVNIVASAVNLRQIVMEMLLEMNASQVYSHILVRDVQNKYDYLSVQEKAFLKRLFEGTLERMIEIDYVLNQFSRVKVNKMKPVIRTIMRMSVYQILYMDSVPDAAVCNEAVKLAEMKKFQTLKGFVNGVLRNIARNKKQIVYPQRDKDLLIFLSVTYSMPEWIVKRWLTQYDADTVEKILQGLLLEHPVTVRMMKDTVREDIIAEIKKQQTEPEQHDYYKDAYILKGNLDSVGELPGFAEGKITVQDVSSMLAVSCAGIKEGDTVIDVCAAPGGKTMLAAEYAGKTGKIIARDVSAYKTDMIQENIERCHLTNVDTQIWDAREKDERMAGTMDVVLADLPCSGLGVMGKKRDIKYHVSEESLSEIVRLQQEILRAVVSYVKPGGVFLYSTCTINKEENEQMVQWIEKELGLQPESIQPYLPDVLKNEETVTGGYLQLLPGVHKCDGFFIARFRKA